MQSPSQDDTGIGCSILGCEFFYHWTSEHRVTVKNPIQMESPLKTKGAITNIGYIMFLANCSDPFVTPVWIEKVLNCIYGSRSNFQQSFQ